MSPGVDVTIWAPISLPWEAVGKVARDVVPCGGKIWTAARTLTLARRGYFTNRLMIRAELIPSMPNELLRM